METNLERVQAYFKRQIVKGNYKIVEVTEANVNTWLSIKARKLGLNANPHLRKTNVSGSFYYDVRKTNQTSKGLDACVFDRKIL